MSPSAVLFALVLIPSAVAAPWQAELGLGGVVVPGRWTPLTVSVPPDSGPWTLAATSVSASGHETVVTTHYTAGGVIENPFFVAAGARTVRLSFETASGSRALEISLGSRLFAGHVIGVDGVDAFDEAELAEVLLPVEPVKIVELAPSRWPASPLSYGALTALVAQDPGALAPARLAALRVWIASGGALVVTGRLPPGQSLLDLIGTVGGAGKAIEAHAHENWKSKLGLRPYEQSSKWGTDFEPPPLANPPDSPVLKVPLGFILVWAVVALATRARRGLKVLLVWAGLFSAGAVVIVAMGWNSWDRGLSVHGRELELAGLGRFTSVEAVRAGRSGPLDWPAAPWALSVWRDSPGWPRSADTDQLVFDAFLAPVDRTPTFQARWNGRVRWFQWTGSGWQPREEVPDLWRRDEAWIERLASAYPDRIWSGGADGHTVWLKPERGLP
jgi:hypothetical protein